MYRVKGADQKEYGPVDASQVILWIQENRLNRYSLIRKEGEASEKPLDQFPEFAAALGEVPSPPAPSRMTPPLPNAAPVYAPVGDPERAARMVKAPAILLIIISLLGMIFTIVGLATMPAMLAWAQTVLENSGAQVPGQWLTGIKTARAQGLGVMDYLKAGLTLAIFAIVMVGAVRMMKLENWGLALAAALGIMLPCTCPCCVVGLPIGIWAIIVLSNPEVKQAFR